MTTTIEKKFEVEEPIDKVWAYLTNPEKIVVCVPGASLKEKIDERNFTGGVTLKFGPVKAKYNGEITFEEMDRDARKMTLKGKGLDAKGKGSADMLMKSTLTEVAGGTSVDCSMQISIVGKLAQFGARLINEVTEQIFNQFVNNFKAKLAEEVSFEEATRNPTAAAESVVDAVIEPKNNNPSKSGKTTVEKAEAVKESAEALEKALADVQEAQAALDGDLRSAAVSAGVIDEAKSVEKVEPKIEPVTKQETDNSLNAFSLIWSIIKGWFARLFGGGK